MEDSMIERVALALEPKCRAFGKGDMPMAVAREFARAAIEAMREPTEDMIIFGSCHEDQDHDIFDEGHISREVWQAMIDAALSPTQPPERT